MCKISSCVAVSFPCNSKVLNIYLSDKTNITLSVLFGTIISIHRLQSSCIGLSSKFGLKFVIPAIICLLTFFVQKSLKSIGALAHIISKVQGRSSQCHGLGKNRFFVFSLN